MAAFLSIVFLDFCCSRIVQKNKIAIKISCTQVIVPLLYQNSHNFLILHMQINDFKKQTNVTMSERHKRCKLRTMRNRVRAQTQPTIMFVITYVVELTEKRATIARREF